MRGFYGAQGLDGWLAGVCLDVFGAGQAVSGIANAAGTIEAASIQADAINNATDMQQQRYETTRGDLLPYNQLGQSAEGVATGNLDQYGDTGQGALSTMQQDTPVNTATGVINWLPNLQDMSQLPGLMTQSQLEQMPGYQFQRDQGIKATESSAAARGLGVSGAAMKGAATYATGLADSNYMNLFNQEQQQFSDQFSKDNQNFNQRQSLFGDVSNWGQNVFTNQQNIETDALNQGQFQQSALTNSENRLMSVAGLGENAAAQTGNAGAQAANAAGNYAMQGASSIGNTIQSGTNALTSGINNYSNAQQQNSLLSQLLGGGGSSGASSYGASGNEYAASSGTGISMGTYNEEEGY